MLWCAHFFLAQRVVKKNYRHNMQTLTVLLTLVAWTWYGAVHGAGMRRADDAKDFNVSTTSVDNTTTLDLRLRIACARGDHSEVCKRAGLGVSWHSIMGAF